MRRLMSLGLLTLQFVATAGGQGIDEYVASTPCDLPVRTFLGVARETPCERITWHVALAPGAGGGDFTLRVHYGMTVPNSQDLAGGGTRAELRGTWAPVPTTDDGADVRLTLLKPRRALLLRRLDANLFHIQDERGALLVGNGGWSYTLNRRDPIKPARQLPSRSAVRDVTAGTFDGRTPCLAMAARLGSPVPSDCAKLKWRLLLQKDPATGAHGRYALEGTLYRDRPHTGRWSIDPQGKDARATIIRLDPTEGGAFLSFLIADDNILVFLDKGGQPLVGNADFSFTLNRKPQS